ncbi:MAG: hypothetical protein LBT47_03045 [Deltaproteobacteria bacterium]|jgi:nitrogenase molybdenum-iron protein beta chain|nr:hypothetical protein [Deltaproteobacteria bacterium]
MDEATCFFRGGCAFHGALWTAASIEGLTPVVHSNAGCVAQAFLAARASGIGLADWLQIPSTRAIERHVVFGGGSRLREQIKNTVKIIEARLYGVIHGCESAMVGDDIPGLTKEAVEATHRVICSLVCGLHGDSRLGYSRAMADFVAAAGDFKDKIKLSSALGPESPPRVNILGVVPVTDLNYRGDLLEIARLLEGLGVRANIFFGPLEGVEELVNAGDADLSLIFSKWGQAAARKLLELHTVPLAQLPSMPLGFKGLKTLSEILTQNLQAGPWGQGAEAFLQSEQLKLEYLLEPLNQFRGEILGAPVALVGDESLLAGLAGFLRDELGAEIVLAIITEPLSDDEASGDDLANGEDLPSSPQFQALSEFSAQVVRTSDSAEIERLIAQTRPLIILGGEPEKVLAEKYGTGHLTVSFPGRQIVLGRTYVGINGAAALAEAYVSQILAALDLNEENLDLGLKT